MRRNTHAKMCSILHTVCNKTPCKHINYIVTPINSTNHLPTFSRTAELLAQVFSWLQSSVCVSLRPCSSPELKLSQKGSEPRVVSPPLSHRFTATHNWSVGELFYEKGHQSKPGTKLIILQLCPGVSAINYLS